MSDGQGSDGGRPRLGLIGFGAIGQDVHRRLADRFDIVVLLRAGSPRRTGMPAATRIVATLDDLIAWRPQIVVEAAGQEALRALAPAILEAGLVLVAASTGAFEDEAFLAGLAASAERGGGRLIVPPGAVGGLDYLAAVRTGADLQVRYTSRKPLAAWRSELAAAGMTSPGREVVLFEGSVAEAARRYPRNLNAGLTIALAAGAAGTTVRVIADPEVTLNTHEIEVESALGTAFMRFANRPAPGNPKTSALTAASIASVVTRYFERVMV